MDATKAKISELAEKFRKYQSEGKLPSMSENDTKAIFIEPLFEALGWNVRDLDEVSREEKVSKGKVDYAFRLSGVIRFFIEAKAAGIALGDKEAEQAIRYSYYKSVPWVILTNFRQLIIYNSEWREGENQFLKFDFEEFAPRLNELLYLSRESFARGEIDKYAEKVGRGKKREPFAKALFSDFREWRRMLSKNIMEHSRLNKLTKEQADEGVQRLLNRLVFIRTCEDRKLENQRLQEAVRTWKAEKKKKLVRYLPDLVFDFNDTYDSDLFGPHLAGELYVDDHVMESLIEGLYKYEFDDIDPDVLGNVYEQYLATIMREGGGLREKESIRKEMGIYYTPTYIVDYIVKNTLGELVKNAKTPEDLEKIRVLDPACGSGSFLIRAYDLLSDVYAKKNGGDQDMLGENVSRNAYNILTKNLFGVDLDPKAVEIAELNLLLRAARKRGRLPPLSDNIKRGNSLISGTREELEKYFGKQWREKHPFNWEDEFAEVMKDGGFDVVIGNPPYVNIKEIDENDARYFRENYDFASGQFDLYTLFIERAYTLLKTSGYFGFIIPDAFLSRSNMYQLRDFLLKNSRINRIFHLSGVFEDPSVANIVLIFQKGSPTDESMIAYQKSENLEEAKNGNIGQKDIKQAYIASLPNCPIIYASEEQLSLLKKIIESSDSKNLDEEVFIFRGEELGKKSEEIVTTEKGSIPFLAGEDIGRYNIVFGGRYIRKKSVRKELDKYLNQKIMIRQLGNEINATLDDKGEFVTIQSVYNLLKPKRFSLKFLLGILNSKTINFYYKLVFGSKQLFPRILIENIRQLPIKAASQSEQEPIIKLVDRMLDINKELNKLGDKQTSERQKLEEEMQRTDRQINELVYKLYGITEEEKKIIEESLKT